MKTYICKKTIQAVPAKMVNGIVWPEGLPLPQIGEPKQIDEYCGGTCEVRIEDGYMFTTSKDDKYPQFMTSKEFEMTCRSTEDMTFGDALDAAKLGKRIARKGWNGKNQYVELATCISYISNDCNAVNVEHNNIGNKALAFVGTSGVQMGWLASQADMLAEDWYIFE